SGSLAIQQSPHRTRMEAARKITTSYRDNQTLVMATKSFEVIDSVDKFYYLMSKYLNPTLDPDIDPPFETDGLVFTPEDVPYFIDIHSHGQGSRNLKLYPDLVKYKRPEEITIDFIVKNNALYTIYDQKRSSRIGVSSKLYSSIGSDDLVKFVGSVRHPFSDKVDLSSPILK